MEKFKLLAFAIMAFHYSIICAQVDWIDFNNEGENMQIPDIDMYSSTNIDIDFFGVTRYQKIENDTTYDVMLLPGNYGKTIDIGFPQIPLLTFYIEVTADTPTITVNSKDYVFLDNYYLLPAQESETLEGSDTLPPFMKNDSIYNLNQFFPLDNVKVSLPSICRGHKIITVVVCPIQHNPVTKEIKALKNIDFSILGAGSIEFDRDNIVFDNFLQSNVINYIPNAESDNIIDLLIITPDIFEDDLLQFEEWKEKLGYRTKVVTRSEIETDYQWIADPIPDNNFIGIDGYINYAYINWGSEAPEFILLVGETDEQTTDMPTHYWYNDNPFYPSDLYYTTMDFVNLPIGVSWIFDFPDMFIGRMSIDDEIELNVLLDKVIDYAFYPPNNNIGYFDNILLATFFQTPEPGTPNANYNKEELYYTYTTETIAEYLEPSYSLNRVYLTESPDPILYKNNEEVDPNIIFYGELSGYPAEQAVESVINSINNGCFLVNHRDHGMSGNATGGTSTERWGHPGFGEDQIQDLNNANILPVMFSINCRTGWFDGGTDPGIYKNYDCLGEQLLNQQDKGIVGFIGAVRKSYGGYNEEFNKGLIDAIWEDFDPSYGSDVQCPTYTLGSVLNHGKFYMFNKYIITNGVNYIWDTTDKKNRWSFERFHLLGDPTMEMWTGVPQPLYAYVDFDDNSVTVYDENDQVIPDAKVVFQYGPEATEDYEVKMTGENGKVYSDLLVNYNVEVSALKHNYIPWYSTIITENTTWPDEENVRGNIIVANGSVLTFANNKSVPKYARIIVMEGASLNISENKGLSFSNNYNDILAFGNLFFEPNSSISTNEGQVIVTVNLLNENLGYGFYDVNFNNCNIVGKPASLVLNEVSLNNCVVEIEKADVNIMGSVFTNSSLDVSSPNSGSSYVYVTDDCSFTGATDAINIERYSNYRIMDSEISGCVNGIRLFNAGSSKGLKQISGNEIHTNSGTGVLVYNSFANIDMNTITGNAFGVKSLDNSNVVLKGNSNATAPEQTQQIADNSDNEVYASQGSFPFLFKYNAIVDEDNTQPMVKYKTILLYEELDVTDNYWGTSLDPAKDLYPTNFYTYLPIWQLNGSGGMADGAEAKYNNAQLKIENDDFIGAEADLLQIVLDYPTSKFAQAALRELFSLEEDAGDDYASLKAYYDNEANIQNNPDLAKLADYLMNFCEIKLNNWPTAIAWFENVIQNPETMEDSIFAIIDLGYTYFLMENGGLKSAYAGNLTEHIPASINQFTEKRDYLLSLLPEDTEKALPTEKLNSLKEGELLQNIPNPFKETTEIWYKLGKDSDVKISIHNNSGQLIRSFDLGKQTKGNHYIEFNGNDLPDGVYFYSISINGKTTDSKKMTIIK